MKKFALLSLATVFTAQLLTQNMALAAQDLTIESPFEVSQLQKEAAVAERTQNAVKLIAEYYAEEVPDDLMKGEKINFINERAKALVEALTEERSTLGSVASIYSYGQVNESNRMMVAVQASIEHIQKQGQIEINIRGYKTAALAEALKQHRTTVERITTATYALTAFAFVSALFANKHLPAERFSKSAMSNFAGKITNYLVAYIKSLTNFSGGEIVSKVWTTIIITASNMFVQSKLEEEDLPKTQVEQPKAKEPAKDAAKEPAKEPAKDVAPKTQPATSEPAPKK